MTIRDWSFRANLSNEETQGEEKDIPELVVIGEGRSEQAYDNQPIGFSGGGRG